MPFLWRLTYGGKRKILLSCIPTIKLKFYFDECFSTAFLLHSYWLKNSYEQEGEPPFAICPNTEHDNRKIGNAFSKRILLVKYIFTVFYLLQAHHDNTRRLPWKFAALRDSKKSF